ncbi:S8 family serine peptidase [Atopobacter phocae]|uniref:S8 family serine peptidase n=1 Tax=Atopobacter phocae TaxID=136492 RepID=UPI00047019E4|nr:S8 family serine peptidase [Atopobacter phocae]
MSDQPKGIRLAEQLDTTHTAPLQKDVNGGAGTVIAVLDVGFDVEHPYFKLNKSLKGSNQLVTKESLDALKAKENINYGKWVNEKIIFEHDYIKNDEILRGSDIQDDHGTHVAGTIAGNTDKPSSNGFVMNGIAPNAQLMLMKIGGEANKSEFAKSYAQAILDAVRLGATVINLSAGKTADSDVFLTEEVLNAVKAAKDKGVAIIAAAGNEEAFGGAYSKPSADHPDFGTVNSPSILDDVISVGAYQPSQTLSLEGRLKGTDVNVSFPLAIAKSFEANKDYQMADGGFGSEEELTKDKIAGKIVLVTRGQYDFSDILKRSETNGAVGVLIVNNVQDGNFTIPYDAYPLGMISQKDGETLRSHLNGTLSFTSDYKVGSSVGGRRMIKQSSWGVNNQGEIKPDVVAPGYEVHSSISKEKFGIQSGSSMAAPHVAGTMALLHQKYAKLFPNMSQADRTALIKKVLLSSATALFDEESQTFYSPRQQGAGAINADKSANAKYYLTGTNGQSKINLHNIKDNSFDLTFQIHSIDGKVSPEGLDYQVHWMTDQVKEGKFALKPKALGHTEWTPLQMNQATNEVTVRIDLSQVDDELKLMMKNGYFVDGFVRVRSHGQSSEELMSIPFIGFKGDFNNLPAIESSIYDQLAGKFYGQGVESFETNQFDFDSTFGFKEKNYTALKSEYKPFELIEAEKQSDFNPLSINASSSHTFLGSYDHDEEGFLKTFVMKDGQVYLAISPNGDGNLDELEFQGTVLRNVKNLKAVVFKKGEENRILWTSEVTPSTRKNFSNNVQGYTSFSHTKWDGKKQDGTKVEDGEYIYRILYTPTSNGAEEQAMDFLIYVDTVAPELPKMAQFDEATRQLAVVQTADLNDPSIYRARVAFSYSVASEEGNMTFTKYFTMDESGMIHIPESFENELGESVQVVMDQLVYVVEDRAGNFSSVKLNDLLAAYDVKGEPKKDHNQNTDQETEEKAPEHHSENQSKPLPHDKMELNPSNPMEPKHQSENVQPKSDANQATDKEKSETMNTSHQVKSSSAVALPQTGEAWNTHQTVGLWAMVVGCFAYLSGLVKRENKENDNR